MFLTSIFLSKYLSALVTDYLANAYYGNLSLKEGLI